MVESIELDLLPLPLNDSLNPGEYNLECPFLISSGQAGIAFKTAKTLLMKNVIGNFFVASYNFATSLTPTVIFFP